MEGGNGWVGEDGQRTSGGVGWEDGDAFRQGEEIICLLVSVLSLR